MPALPLLPVLARGEPEVPAGEREATPKLSAAELPEPDGVLKPLPSLISNGHQALPVHLRPDAR